jgi:hypothetical protein
MGFAMAGTYLGASGRWVWVDPLCTQGRSGQVHLLGGFGDMAVQTWFLNSPVRL